VSAGDAAVRVVLDQPGHRAVRRLRGRFGLVIGGLLVVLGSLATAAAFVYTII
jgi:hypothetical protein